MNRGGCQVHRSVARAGVLMLVAVLIALCGSVPAAFEPGAGPSEVAAMSVPDPVADDNLPQSVALRAPRTGRTDRSPTARALMPSLPCRAGRLDRLLARWTDLRPGVPDAAGDRARHTVLRC
ncbi:hypothetical protein [Streptomyces sp. NPDC052496]|uniref:hypothetical protein n=1 Tax=Streptomyces sp. NPDC052496 TaxID=3154951 RepID=UPI003415A93C